MGGYTHRTTQGRRGLSSVLLVTQMCNGEQYICLATLPFLLHLRRFMEVAAVISIIVKVNHGFILDGMMVLLQRSFRHRIYSAHLQDQRQRHSLLVKTS